MSLPESDAIAVEELAEEFLERRRRGERPTLAEYTARYPHLADEIREFFPVLGLVEEFKPGSGDLTGSVLGAAGLGDGTPLERLGDFRMLREVGRGGMGIVYEAEQESLGRRVALKVLAGNRTLDPKLLLRFHREAKAAARLHHTNIVPVFGVGEAEGLHFYVMQFIQGLGLDQVLDELRRLPAPAARGFSDSSPSRDLTPADVARSLVTGHFAGTALQDSVTAAASRRDGTSSSVTLPGQGQSGLSTATDSARQYLRSVARIGLQVAEALEHAHEQGTLHRDIKPSNLLLDAHGTVWVTDFGLAKVTTESDLTHTGDIVGTIRYMAPERFAGHCDARADVYALGLTLYELLTKRPAFEADDRNTLIRAVTQSEPKRLRTLDRSIPRDLETIVHKAIEKDPAHRYASAAALAEDLRRFLEDRPIAARRIGPAEQLARWARRNPGIAALSATVFGLLGLLALGATVAAVRVEGEARRAIAARDAEHAARQDVETANASLRASQDNLRRTAYAARLNLAQAAFEAGDVVRVAALLDETRPEPGAPDLRGFEWHYWRRQLHGERSTRRFLAPAFYSSLVLSSDGTRVAGLVGVGYGRFDLVVIDVATQRTVFSQSQPTYVAGSSRRFSLALNRDGTRLASYRSSTGGIPSTPGGRVPARVPLRLELKVWDVDTGKALLAHEELGSPGDTGTVAISRDGTRVARFVHRSLRGGRSSTSPYEGNLAVWDVGTGRRLLEAAPALVAIVQPVFRPDGARLALNITRREAPDGSYTSAVHEWDLSTGQERTLGSSRSHEQYWPSTYLCYSPDGAHLAVERRASGAAAVTDNAIAVLDAATGRELFTVAGIRAPISSSLNQYDPTAWSPDGRMLALVSAHDSSVQLVDATSGRRLEALHGHRTVPAALAFRPDGAGLVSIDSGGTLKEWDVAPAALDSATSLPSARNVREGNISHDGRWVAEIRQGPSADSWSVTVRAAEGGRERGRVAFPALAGWAVTVHGVSISPDGSAVAISEQCYPSPAGDVPWQNRVTVADVVRGRFLHLAGTDWNHGPGPTDTGMGFRPDGGALALAFNGGGKAGGRVQVNDIASGRVLMRWDALELVNCVAFRPDGRALAAGFAEGLNSTSPARVRIWDAGDGHILGTRKGDPNSVYCLAFSPDGARLAAACGPYASSSPGPVAVLVWDLNGPASAPLRLPGLSSAGRHLAFSGDGRRIASFGVSRAGDWTLNLWDAASGQAVFSFSRYGGYPGNLGMSPDGRQIRTLLRFGNDSRMMVWDARPLPAPIEAGRLVERLAEGRLTRSELRAAVAAEPDLPDDVRAAALAQADAWPEDRVGLIRRALRIADEPGRPAAELSRALEYAEAAVAMYPDEQDGRYTRGLVRLRLGQLAEARDDLEASARAGNDPAAWGLLALAEIQLGHRPAAEAALGEMTRRAARVGFDPLLEIPADLRRQAESSILEPIFPADPFAPAR
jgi:serine/threonine protein kinase/WD40 repeat protein